MMALRESGLLFVFAPHKPRLAGASQSRNVVRSGVTVDVTCLTLHSFPREMHASIARTTTTSL